MRSDIYLALVFEDELSEAVLRRLLIYSNRPFVVSHRIPARGSGNIKRDISKYKTACKKVPHIVLTDLDQYQCPPALIESWNIRNLPSELLFRIAVREIESWLLADIDGLSAFLKVPKIKFPAYPESLADPKQTLLNIVRRSGLRSMRDEIIPSPGSAACQGALYNHHLCRFVLNNWNVQAASAKAPSLAKMITRLSGFLI